MRKIFQQKYVLRVIAFLVLALAIVNVSAPKIEEYNLAVVNKQEELRREADGVDKQATFSFAFYSSTDPSRFFTFPLIMLFLSLIFTKRITLSFLFLFLFCVQLRLVSSILSNIRAVDYFPYPEDYGFYYELLIMSFLVILSFWLAISICRFFNQRLQSNLFLK